MDRASREDHLASCPDTFGTVRGDEFYAVRTISVEKYFGHVCVQQKSEVGAVEIGAQERTGRAHARAVGRNVHVDVTGARPQRTVYIIDNGKAHLPRSFEESGRGGMRIARLADMNWAADTAPMVGAPFPILLGLKHWQHVLEGPTRRAISFPGVVVMRHPARPHHRIDGTAAAQNMPERHIE